MGQGLGGPTPLGRAWLNGRAPNWLSFGGRRFDSCCPQWKENVMFGGERYK